MNQTLKSTLIFLSGMAVGAVGTYFVTRKAFEAKADEEIEQVRAVYDEKVQEIEGAKSSVDGDIEGPSEIEEGKKLSHKELVEKLNNKPDLTDYSKYFKAKGEKIDISESIRDAKEAADKEGLSEEELAEREGPEDDEPYSDEEDREETLNYEDHELNGAHKEAMAENKPPYEIEPSDYELTCANYEKFSYIWYHFDQIIVNEEEEIVDNGIFRGLMDVIESSGFDSDDSDVIYIRDDKLMADFEITKVYEQFKPGE